MCVKVFKLVLVFAVVWLISMPDVGMTQGVIGRVLNRRTRQVFPTINAALAASQPGDVLLAAGRLDGAVDLSLAPGAVTILGETRVGYIPTITVAGCPLSLAVIDGTGRLGAVQLVGLNIEVPVVCIGVLSVMNGMPLTVRNCRFFGESPASPFAGIVLSVESGGPFTLLGNTISTTQVTVGIQVIGDGATPIQANIRSNRIGNLSSRVLTAGIAISDIPPSSNVVVERNIVEGGNPPTTSQIGIRLQPVIAVGAEGVIVRRNTVSNFIFGVVVDGSPDSQILANLLRNNVTGIAVDTTTDSVTTPRINDNNITCTNIAGCKAAGAVGLSYTMGTYPLDAMNNFWGARSGPDSANTPSPGNLDCPEATCNPPAGGGTGLPVDSAGATDCGTGVGTVTTCPIRTVQNLFAGA